MGSRGRWGAKGGLFHTLEHKSSHYVLIEMQKGAHVQCTFQAEKVIRSSFTPNVALLVHPRDTIHLIEDRHGFTRSPLAVKADDASKSRPFYI